MSIIVKPNTFTDGTTAVAAQVNANFDTLYSDHNGNITDANIAASGVTTYGKVSGAALSSLGSINAGAGTIPAANIQSLPDSSLAQITTASKVSGAALTLLPNIPAGAGVIPVANLGTGTPSSSNYLRGDGSFAVPASNTTQMFTSNGTWTAPAGITRVMATMCGGGGGGSGGTVAGGGSGGGGGAGAYITQAGIDVVAGNTYNVTVGIAGTLGAINANGGNGGNSSFAGVYTVTANGGTGGNKTGGIGGAGGTATGSLTPGSPTKDIAGSITTTAGIAGATGDGDYAGGGAGTPFGNGGKGGRATGTVVPLAATGYGAGGGGGYGYGAAASAGTAGTQGFVYLQW